MRVERLAFWLAGLSVLRPVRSSILLAGLAICACSWWRRHSLFSFLQAIPLPRQQAGMHVAKRTTFFSLRSSSPYERGRGRKVLVLVASVAWKDR